jgi:hypothetical protein
MLSGANLMAQSSPIKISLENFYNQFIKMSYPKVHITSIEDNLEIKNVSVNKGHCKLLNGNPINNIFPKKLSYSQKVNIPLGVNCSVLRIDVETNQGDWSVEY